MTIWQLKILRKDRGLGLDFPKTGNRETLQSNRERNLSYWETLRISRDPLISTSNGRQFGPNWVELFIKITLLRRGSHSKSPTLKKTVMMYVG